MSDDLEKAYLEATSGTDQPEGIYFMGLDGLWYFVGRQAKIVVPFYPFEEQD